MAHIDERTKVPLFAVLVSLPFLFGGILWLTSIDSKASQAKEDQQSAKEEMQTVRSMLEDVRERVIRIEEKVRRR